MRWVEREAAKDEVKPEVVRMKDNTVQPGCADLWGQFRVLCKPPDLNPVVFAEVSVSGSGLCYYP